MWVGNQQSVPKNATKPLSLMVLPDSPFAISQSTVSPKKHDQTSESNEWFFPDAQTAVFSNWNWVMGLSRSFNLSAQSPFRAGHSRE
jgi:hypothetical protein